MPIIHISNDYLQVSIDTKGAELQNIFNKKTGLEYLWSGDAAFWGKKSPVLFPIVGGLKNNSYTYNNQTYTLGRHGFARDKEFKVDAHYEEVARFLLESDEETMQTYPFPFSFGIEYSLYMDFLYVQYVIVNNGEQDMYFSVGAHPAFKVPLTDSTVLSDYYLQFNQKEDAGIWPLSETGLIENTSTPLLNSTDQLQLTKELFYKDALVFKGLHSNSISILSHKTQHGIKVQFNGFPYMGIWQAKDAGFVCIEPWCGIADSVNATGKLEEKEGIISIQAKESFSKSWNVQMF